MSDFKRYMLFVFETFYPQGGMEDFISDEDDFDILIETSKRFCKKEMMYLGNIQIYDTKYKKVVFAGVLNDQIISSRDDYENIKVIFDERDGLGESN